MQVEVDAVSDDEDYEGAPIREDVLLVRVIHNQGQAVLPVGNADGPNLIPAQGIDNNANADPVVDEPVVLDPPPPEGVNGIADPPQLPLPPDLEAEVLMIQFSQH